MAKERKPKERKAPIYFITTLRFGYKYLDPKRNADGYFHSYEKRTSPEQKEYFTIISSRTWSWHRKFKTAEECVLRDCTFMSENEYTYAVIEEIYEGCCWGMKGPQEWWFKWEGDWDTGGYKPDQKPEDYERVVCFLNRVKGKVEPDPNRVSDSR